jgi:hypothetical protein
LAVDLQVDEGSGVEKEAEGGEAEVDNTPTIERIVLDMPASECIGKCQQAVRFLSSVSIWPLQGFAHTCILLKSSFYMRSCVQEPGHVVSLQISLWASAPVYAPEERF